MSRNPSIYNRDIFATMAYLELKTFSEVCQTCQMIRHIQSPGIFGTVYSSIFKDIDTYSVTLTGAQLRGREETSTVYFEN